MPKEEKRKVIGNPAFETAAFISGHECSGSWKLIFQDSKHNGLKTGVWSSPHLALHSNRVAIHQWFRNWANPVVSILGQLPPFQLPFGEPGMWGWRRTGLRSSDLEFVLWPTLGSWTMKSLNLGFSFSSVKWDWTRCSIGPITLDLHGK